MALPRLEGAMVSAGRFKNPKNPFNLLEIYILYRMGDTKMYRSGSLTPMMESYLAEPHPYQYQEHTHRQEGERRKWRFISAEGDYLLFITDKLEPGRSVAILTVIHRATLFGPPTRTKLKPKSSLYPYKGER